MRRIAQSAMAVLFALSFSRIAWVQQNQIHVLHVQGNVYMLVGPGGNTTVQAGDDGVLMVDTKTANVSADLLAAISQLSKKPIHYIVNTGADPDHTGGNEPLSKAGNTITGGNVLGNISDAGEGAAIVAHENVLSRMPREPFRALPTDTFFTEEKDLFFNGEAIQLLHQPAAHTDGDTIVFFRRSDVVSTGDIFLTTTYPVIDVAKGGSINGIVNALNRIIDITIPRDKQEGGTMVIPGHGRLCDEADVVEYRDMLTIIRDRIQDMIEKRMSLQQVKAAQPTLDYDARYGATSGPWTTDMFVDAAYRSLMQEKK
jgi:cyclase